MIEKDSTRESINIDIILLFEDHSAELINFLRDCLKTKKLS
jgi:hypothetical protein